LEEEEMWKAANAFLWHAGEELTPSSFKSESFE